MLREGVFICGIWAVCLSAGNSQPVFCTAREHCAEGYFCDTETKICRECLRCQDLKREPLLQEDQCVMSIEKCGSCFKGYVVDHRGDVAAPCVKSDSVDPVDSGTPHYVWWIIGVLGIGFLVVMIGIIYIYTNPGVLKFGDNCPSSIVSTNIMTAHRPSAPEGPPPYSAGDYNNIPYSSVRADTPSSAVHEAGDIESPGEDGPFIKRAPAPLPSGQREKAGSQAARVFQRPVYDRDEPTCPEYPIPLETHDSAHIHDETTMPSFWTAEEPSNDSAISSAGNTSEIAADTEAGETSRVSLPALLDAARHTTLLETPPAKRARRASTSSEESDRETHRGRHRESGHGAGNTQGNFTGTHNGTPYLIINNVVQVNQNS